VGDHLFRIGADEEIQCIALPTFQVVQLPLCPEDPEILVAHGEKVVVFAREGGVCAYDTRRGQWDPLPPTTFCPKYEFIDAAASIGGTLWMMRRGVVMWRCEVARLRESAALWEVLPQPYVYPELCYDPHLFGIYR
jgi:hypothetical protein